MSKVLFEINQEAYMKLLNKSLNEGMTVAAEPIIEKALKDIEQTMREKLASMLISYIEKNIIIDRLGEDLRITIRQAINK